LATRSRRQTLELAFDKGARSSFHASRRCEFSALSRPLAAFDPITSGLVPSEMAWRERQKSVPRYQQIRLGICLFRRSEHRRSESDPTRARATRDAPSWRGEPSASRISKPNLTSLYGAVNAGCGLCCNGGLGARSGPSKGRATPMPASRPLMRPRNFGPEIPSH